MSRYIVLAVLLDHFSRIAHLPAIIINRESSSKAAAVWGAQTSFSLTAFSSHDMMSWGYSSASHVYGMSVVRPHIEKVGHVLDVSH